MKKLVETILTDLWSLFKDWLEPNFDYFVNTIITWLSSALPPGLGTVFICILFGVLITYLLLKPFLKSSKQAASNIDKNRQLSNHNDK